MVLIWLVEFSWYKKLAWIPVIVPYNAGCICPALVKPVYMCVLFMQRDGKSLKALNFVVVIFGFTCGTQGCCALGGKHVPETSPKCLLFLADSDCVQISSDPVVGISGDPGQHKLLGQEMLLQYMQATNALFQVHFCWDRWQIWFHAYLEATCKRCHICGVNVSWGRYELPTSLEDILSIHVNCILF